MALGIVPKFQFRETTLDTGGLITKDNYYAAGLGSPAILHNKLVYLLGQKTHCPLSMMLLGDSNFKDFTSSKIRSLDDIQFTYPVMGQTHKNCYVSSDCTTDGLNNNHIANKVGDNGVAFKLRFPDNWIKRHFVLYNDDCQVRVQADPKQIGNEFEYTVVSLNGNYVPNSLLTPGNVWVPLYTVNSEVESRGTESTLVAPGAAKNQMSIIRHSMKWAGDVAHRVMQIEVDMDGKKGSSYLDYGVYHFEKQWMHMRENILWYSVYNRTSNGDISLVDDQTGRPIPTGAGLLEQIGNKLTYSKLTYDILDRFISHTYRNISDAEGKEITLMTGRGGMREFNEAMKNYAGTMNTLLQGNVANKFVEGAGRELALTGFFTRFAHIDGYNVNIVYNPWFDHGEVARQQLASGLVHPVTGFAKESYRMVFLDTEDVNGMPNIQLVTKKGLEFRHGLVRGLTDNPASLQSMGSLENVSLPNVSTDQDVSSYHRMQAVGVQLQRSSRCLDIQLALTKKGR